MKKKLSVLLVLTLALSMILTGCSEKEKDAYTLYTEMTKAMEGVKSVDMDITMKMGMEVAGETMDFDFSGSAQEIIRSETDVEMAMVLNVDMSAYGLGKIPVSSYYKDGFMYQDMMGMKTKMAMDVEEMTSQAGLEMFEFGSDAVDSSEITEVDGGKQLSFVLKGDAVTEMVDSLVAGQLDSLGVGDVDMTVGDVTYKALIGADSMPISQEMNLTISMTIEGETANMSMDMIIDYNGFNNVESIDFPNDLDSYMQY